jgi:succinylarginine dihydrolase
MSETIEVNLDGLVGPTHHFGGLGVGNLASKRHRHLTSSPKRAALEGLRKAFQLAQSGGASVRAASLASARLADAGAIWL